MALMLKTSLNGHHIQQQICNKVISKDPQTLFYRWSSV